MARRRARGEGSIRKRKDGRWEGRYSVGRNTETGKLIYKSVLARTQAECKNKLREAILELHDQKIKEPEGNTKVSQGLYDLKKQEECLAGGSGPVCSALVAFGYIYHEMKKKNLKKVLIVATGALFSPTMVYQKENIYSIANAISLEVV